MRTGYWILILLLFIGIGGAFLVVPRLAKPQVMQLTMPKPKRTERPTTVSAHDLTFLLEKQGIYYYFGPNKPGQGPVLHAAGAMPTVEKVLQDWSQHSKGHIYIKPGEEAYKQLVAMLDEMNITNQTKYSVENQTAADRQLLTRQQP